MSDSSAPFSPERSSTSSSAQVVEDDVELSLAELCRACEAERELIVELVSYGVLEPRGVDARESLGAPYAVDPASWRFAGSSLRRGRVALRLIRHLEVNAAGAAVAVELIEQIEELRTTLAVQSPRRR